MTRPKRLLTSVAALLVLAGYGRPARADDEQAVAVYKRLRTAVVSLENVEGSGTGVLVGSDGLILTNAHVVASPLPFTVKVAGTGTGTGTGKGKDKPDVTYHNVRVVGYHPRLDLALVRIDPAEHAGSTLTPVRIAKAKADPGQQCYVIGNPAGGGGMILTRTITSGMISGVDREVDGERYYQTDAAINPGNSGGPVCDHAGAVLGLVTFRFTDVAATGFAIPLFDVDLTKFVPITERKGDPAKAAELTKVADHFATLAERAAREKGLDSEDRKLFNAYAVLSYHEALLDDPVNPALYYDVGMLLRTLDEDEVAAGYLTRCVELQPWDGQGGAVYRELGLTLAKLKRDDQAAVVWGEGVAKWPYNSKIWEDRAVQDENAGRFAATLFDAGTAVLIREQDTRVDVLKQLVREARQRLSAADAVKAEREAEPKAIAASLDKLLAAGNAARKQHKLYVTPAFAALMKSIGGTPVPGVEKAVPTDPQKRVDVLARAGTDATGNDDKPTRRSAGGDGGGWVGGKDEPTTPRRTPKKSAGKADRGDDAMGGSDKGGGDKGGGDPGGSDKGGWVGAGGGTAAAAKPVVTGDDLTKATHESGGATVSLLTTTGAVDAVWSADGKFAFVLQKDGTVRKVAADTMVEERRLDIASPCTALARCDQGVVVAVHGTGEAWLLDDDLTVKRRVPAGGVKQLAASPKQPVVYATAGGDDLQVIDMATGQSTTVEGKEFEDEGGPDEHVRVAFWHIAATPDGKYLFVEGDNVGLMRFAVSGRRLRYDGASPVGADNVGQISVSGDSRYVCVVAGAGNGIRGVSAKPYSTFVFAVRNLNRPATILESGAYPRAVGFDVAAHTIYAQNYQKPLIAFSGTGQEGKSYKLAAKGGNAGDVERFVVDPAGHRLFVVTSEKLFWVQLDG